MRFVDPLTKKERAELDKLERKVRHKKATYRESLRWYDLNRTVQAAADRARATSEQTT